ncbi:MAG: hypothetical protein ACRD1P_12425, partial [Thermoanaerobaculia bacterium]
MHGRLEGPLAPPSEYTVRLTAGGRSLAQPLSLKMDPRVTTPEAQLRQQSELATRIAQVMNRDFETLERVRALRWELQKRKERVKEGVLAGEIAALAAKAAALEGQSEGAGTPTAGTQSLTRLSRRLATLLNVVDGADAAPTAQATA